MAEVIHSAVSEITLKLTIEEAKYLHATLGRTQGNVTWRIFDPLDTLLWDELEATNSKEVKRIVEEVFPND